ncbi:hypothetical protein QOT17_002669 [Balamuthia mandrillaris]
MATCTLLFQLFMLHALASCSFTAVLVGEILLGVWMLVTVVVAVIMIGTITFVTSNFILFYHNDNDDNIDNDSKEKHKESQHWSKMFGFLAVGIIVSTIGFGPVLIVQVCIFCFIFILLLTMFFKFLLIKRFDLLRKMLRQKVKDEENATIDICLNEQTLTSSDEMLENSCKEVN